MPALQCSFGQFFDDVSNLCISCTYICPLNKVWDNLCLSRCPSKLFPSLNDCSHADCMYYVSVWLFVKQLLRTWQRYLTWQSNRSVMVPLILNWLELVSRAVCDGIVRKFSGRLSQENGYMHEKGRCAPLLYGREGLTDLYRPLTTRYG